ncbi:hypothetical protein OEA41_001620 [Lepraria neglecta]|uniref:OTU domain-containing protein n=1 Tax=Lepraria neglecta TaxID=209136 RepID=A0AAE0DLN7_9LECA|nr:hypothetical protein OEA41_001620 [Lepraria neglecta]
MAPKNEIPQLKARGVYAADTAGNGDCLFHALSDQLFGDQSHHLELRVATVDYMRSRPDYYKNFIVVHPGGGTRRNPKRKNAGALSAVDTAGPSAADIEASFQRYLNTMAQKGTYGDNMEIGAFASRFLIHVIIYEEEYRQEQHHLPAKGVGKATRKAYIVRHPYEHYSSIRNIAGPHTGLPNVHMNDEISPEAEATMKAELANIPAVQPWKIETVLRSLPYITDRAIVEQALEEANGDVNEAVSNLLPASSQSSNKTSGTSSSIERDPDSDYEMEQKPKKKQNRRQSRPQPLSNHNLTVRTKDANLFSPDPNQLSAALSKLKDDKDFDPDETEEENWQDETIYKDTESTSVSTSASDFSTASKGESGPIRLKLSQPKKQIAKARPVSTTSSEQSNIGDYDADAEKAYRSRPIAKPRRRLIKGYERERERERLAAENAARLASTKPTVVLHAASKKQNQRVIDMGIKVLHI